MHKLRVLLVDDYPTFAWDDYRRTFYLPEELEEWFEVIWIQDATEARWLLEAFEILSIRAPAKLLEEGGFPPEMLIFDYALTNSPPLRRPDSDTTYRVPAINKLAKSAALKLPTSRPQDLAVPPETGAPRGADRTGCYIGGEFARVFSAHPCGAVPTTAHPKSATDNTDAAFYQWLNDHFFMNLFEFKSRTKPHWKDLLVVAAKALQERIVQLAASGIIRVDLRALKALAAESSVTRNQAVTIRSRFGRRDLPVTGVFIDHLYPGSEKEQEFPPAAREWACRVLENLFAGRGQDAFFAAKSLAEQYMDAYRSDEKDDRYYLSELLAKASRTPSHDEDIEEICARLGLDANTMRNLPEALPPQACMPNWKTASPNDEVARWVALMLAVGVEQQCRKAFGPLTSAGASRPARTENYLTRARAAGIPAERRKKKRRGRSDELGDRRPAEMEDILEALDPLPKDLFTFRQKRKSKAGPVTETTFLTNPLKHLGRADKSWGTLGLNLTDVLADQPFDCDGCDLAIGKDEPPPDHKKNWRHCHHGIRKGEGFLLQIYADELGFPEEKWPVWLKNAP